MNQPACLNASEARAYLRVSERQWNRLVAAGLVKKLPNLRPPGPKKESAPFRGLV